MYKTGHIYIPDCDWHRWPFDGKDRCRRQGHFLKENGYLCEKHHKLWERKVSKIEPRACSYGCDCR